MFHRLYRKCVQRAMQKWMMGKGKGVFTHQYVAFKKNLFLTAVQFGPMPLGEKPGTKSSGHCFAFYLHHTANCSGINLDSTKNSAQHKSQHAAETHF